MRKPAAAFEATYSDWKLIRSRKVVQIVLEVPIEQSGHAYDVLGGMPNPASEAWVGVARLNMQSAGAAEPPAPAPIHTSVGSSKGAGAGDLKERRPFASLPLPQQAALLCQDPMFRAFLNEEFQADCGDTNDVTGQLRWMCGVESRAELNPDSEAGRKFIGYREQFLAWKLVAA